MVLLHLPLALFFPSQCYSFCDEFVGNMVCHGHCWVLKCFGKKPACQLNHLNYARGKKKSFLISFDQKHCACIARGLQRKFLLASDFSFKDINLFCFSLSSKP